MLARYEMQDAAMLRYATRRDFSIFDSVVDAATEFDMAMKYSLVDRCTN